MKRAFRRQTKSPTLRALPFLVLGDVVSLAAAALGDNGLPKRVLIARWGDNLARGQGVTFRVGDKTLASLPGEHEKLGWDTICLDYEHNSAPGHPNFKPDPREIAAHGSIEVVKGEGIYYNVGKYTPSGEKGAPNYPDVSGFFFLDPAAPAPKEVIAVHSVALCQHGQVKGAEFKEAIAASAILSPAGSPSAVAQVMAYCRDLLDLEDSAAPEDISAGMEQLVRAKNDPSEDDAAALDNLEDNETTAPTQDKDMSTANPNANTAPTDADKLKAAMEAIEKLTGTVTTLAASVQTMATGQANDIHNRAVDAELTLACSMGKKVPEALKAKDTTGKYMFGSDQVKTIMAAIPATEATAFLTPEALAASAGGASFAPRTTTNDELAICASLGIKHEDYKKGATVIKPGREPAPGSEQRFAVAG